MTKHIIILLSIISIGMIGDPQITKIQFEDLHVSKFKDCWSDNFQAYYNCPKFRKRQKELNNQHVSISGYLYALQHSDSIASDIVLTEHLVDWHQDSPRQDNFIELKRIQLAIRIVDTLSNQIVKVRGKLSLNMEQSIDRPAYTLLNAEIIK